MADASLLIFGCGYLGERVARRFLSSGKNVVAVTRSDERARQLETEGIACHIARMMDASTLGCLPSAEIVLFAVGFDRTAGQSMGDVYQTGLGNVTERIDPRRLIYISTTGIHSGALGEWIDEDSPCEPVTEGAKNHLAGEQLVARSPIAERSVVLRMAGLYGPGRIPRRDELLAGKVVHADANGWLNLIHVDDAAHVVAAAAHHESPSPTYLVSDGQPVRRAEYMAKVARLLDAPAPRFGEAATGNRGSGNKRVNNGRMLEELGVRLEYPTYREGLAAIVAGEKA